LAVISLTLGAASLAALLLPVPQTVWLFAPTVVLVSFFIGGAWVPASALVSTRADARGLDQGMAFALWNFAWAGGLTAGAALGARLAAATTDAVPYVSLAALGLVTLAAVARRRSLVPATDARGG
jgi:MFS family permease